MNDHSLFIQWDIGLAFFDDFMVLPCTPLLGRVYQGLPDAVFRHDYLFAGTH